MILHIDDNKTIADLQDKFEQCFPGLKIEFYSKAHNWKEATPSKYMLDNEIRIGDIIKANSSNIFEIKSWFQTGKVEQDFRELFGLNVQVFRVKNDKWIQTTKSDQQTLAQLISQVKVL
jgi:hypothetical protein